MGQIFQAKGKKLFQSLSADHYNHWDHIFYYSWGSLKLSCLYWFPFFLFLSCSYHCFQFFINVFAHLFILAIEIFLQWAVVGSSMYVKPHESYQVCVCKPSCLSRVRLFATLWTVAVQVALPWDSPGRSTRLGCQALFQVIFPTQGLNPLISPALAGWFFTTSATWRDASHIAFQFKASCWPLFCWTAFPTFPFSVCCWSAWATQRLWSQIWRVQVQHQTPSFTHALVDHRGPSSQESVPRSPIVPSLRAPHSASPAPGSILCI